MTPEQRKATDGVTTATEICCGGPMVTRRGKDYETGEILKRKVCPKCDQATEWQELTLSLEHYEDGRTAVFES